MKLNLINNEAKKPMALKPADLDPMRGVGRAMPTRHEQLVDQTQTWVAQTFFGTLLKQMQDSPFKSELFSGGRGGEAFSSLYNQAMVDRMSRSAGSKLVNSIVRRIEAKAAYEPAASDAQRSEKKRSPAQGSAQPPQDAKPSLPRSRPGQGFSIAG